MSRVLVHDQQVRRALQAHRGEQDQQRDLRLLAAGVRRAAVGPLRLAAHVRDGDVDPELTLDLAGAQVDVAIHAGLLQTSRKRRASMCTTWRMCSS